MAALVKADYPTIADHYGPDGAALNKDAPAIIFEELKEPVVPGLRGGVTWGRLVQIRVTIWMLDPVAAEGALESFLLALNTAQHGRAGKPEAFIPSGGSTGERGAKYTGTITLRLDVLPAPPLSAAPEDSSVAAKIVTPSGTTEDAGLGA